MCPLYVVLHNLLTSGHFSLRPEDFKRLKAHLIFAELAFLLQKVPALTQSTPLTLLCVIHHLYGAYCMHKETEIPESLTSVPIHVSISSLRLFSQLGRWLGFSSVHAQMQQIQSCPHVLAFPTALWNNRVGRTLLFSIPKWRCHQWGPIHVSSTHAQAQTS